MTDHCAIARHLNRTARFIDDAAGEIAYRLEQLADRIEGRSTYDVDDAPEPEGIELENSPERLYAVHAEGQCLGQTCPIHHRSDHPMRSFPQHWRSDRRIMERVCPHGVGHPDPDDPANAGDSVHGCCPERCCMP